MIKAIRVPQWGHLVQYEALLVTGAEAEVGQ